MQDFNVAQTKTQESEGTYLSYGAFKPENGKS